MVSIDWLTFWFEANKEMLGSLSVEFSMSVKDSKTHKPAQSYKIETKKYFAGVCLWESGECDFEALEIAENGVSIFEHRTILSEEELHSFLMPLVSAL